LVIAQSRASDDGAPCVYRQGAVALAQLIVFKRVELLREMVPKMQKFGILVSGTQSGEAELRVAEETARGVGMSVSPQRASEETISKSLFAFAEQRCNAVLVSIPTHSLKVVGRIVQLLGS